MTDTGIDSRIARIFAYEPEDMGQFSEWYEWYEARFILACFRRTQLEKAWNVYFTFLDTFLEKPFLGHEPENIGQFFEWYEWYEARFILALFKRTQLDKAWNEFFTFLETFLEKS